MGLDQFLYKQKNLYSWQHDATIDVKAEEVKKDGTREEVFRLGGTDSVSIRWEVAYWRKANQIHKWFVDNCGGGEDNCQSMYVDVEKLEELLRICRKVKRNSKLIPHGEVNSFDIAKSETVKIPYKIIEDPTVAKELLPTEAGFFFGSTEYDKYYIEDIDLTIKQLTKILKDLKEEEDNGSAHYISFFYEASW